MINANATLNHHLFKVTIADAVSAVPANRPQYYFNTEITAFASTQEITKPILNDNLFTATHDFCNRASQEGKCSRHRCKIAGLCNHRPYQCTQSGVHATNLHSNHKKQWNFSFSRSSSDCRLTLAGRTLSSTGNIRNCDLVKHEQADSLPPYSHLQNSEQLKTADIARHKQASPNHRAAP